MCVCLGVCRCVCVFDCRCVCVCVCCHAALVTLPSLNDTLTGKHHHWKTHQHSTHFFSQMVHPPLFSSQAALAHAQAAAASWEQQFSEMRGECGTRSWHKERQSFVDEQLVCLVLLRVLYMCVCVEGVICMCMCVCVRESQFML